MNGRASACVSPSTLTCPSCMHSRSAACVRGDARLISSTSTRCANTGPGLNVNDADRWSKTLVPVTSEGSRSGVNWSRRTSSSTARASVRATSVLPTPDLLPSDVTGTSVFDQRSASFTFRPGPVFAHLVLVDEINRASPRTQAALLECMQEGQVSVDGETHALARPFMVLATQNPVEHEGTFPLPEAQLDRFLLRVSLGYPPGAEEARMLAEQTAASGLPLDALVPVCGAAELVEAAAAARAVHVEEALHRYVVSLLHHTRADARLALGASPRAGVALVRASKSLALLRGRGFATADDVRSVAPAVLEHRLLPEPGAGPDVAAAAIADALAGTPPP